MPPPPQPNGGKVTPNLAMDAEATRVLNLTVLQRLDPAVEDILITAAHVTLYDFNIDLNQWVSHRFPLPRAPFPVPSLSLSLIFSLSLQKLAFLAPVDLPCPAALPTRPWRRPRGSSVS